MTRETWPKTLAERLRAAMESVGVRTLARRLAESEDAKEIDRWRRQIYKYLDGTTRSMAPSTARLFEQALGTDPGYFTVDPTPRIRLVSSQTALELDDLRAEVVNATADLWEELGALRTRVEQLEAWRARREGPNEAQSRD